MWLLCVVGDMIINFPEWLYKKQIIGHKYSSKTAENHQTYWKSSIKLNEFVFTW
jgi:hypothetical protein